MAESTIDPDDVVVRPFADWLIEQSSGKTHSELGEGLHDLIARVRDTGKKGTVSLIVTVAPMKDSDNILIVSDEIKLRLPEHDRQASVFYADDNGNLTRRDPQQLTFDSLREVPEVGKVDTATGEIKEAKA